MKGMNGSRLKFDMFQGLKNLLKKSHYFIRQVHTVPLCLQTVVIFKCVKLLST